MVFFRSGVGFFMTTGCVAFTFFSEFIPAESDPDSVDADSPRRIESKPWLTRGRILSVQGIFWSAGALFSVLLAWISLRLLSWRWYLVLSSAPLFLATLGACFLQKSPQFLVAANQKSVAKHILSDIAKRNGKTLPPNWRLQSDPKPQRGRLCDLMDVEYRRTTVLLWIVYSMCVFSYYGVCFLSVRYFEGMHSSLYLGMTVTTLAELPSLLIVVLCIHRLGRRGIMNVAFFAFSVTIYLLVFEQLQRVRVIGVALVFVARMFINVGFAGMGIYFLDFYRTEIRATALGFAVTLGRFAGIMTTFTAESLSITLGMYLYGCAGLIAFVASVLIEKDSVEVMADRKRKRMQLQAVCP